ncbi:hypothetical protein V8C40DRAFT_136663 [Trichoderma camerunense]
MCIIVRTRWMSIFVSIFLPFSFSLLFLFFFTTYWLLLPCCLILFFFLFFLFRLS